MKGWVAALFATMALMFLVDGWFNENSFEKKIESLLSGLACLLAVIALGVWQ